MTFQKTVRLSSGLGVPGEILLHGPKRAGAYVVNSGDQANNVGAAFTFNPDGNSVKVGGTGVFAGILANPKVYPLRGNIITDNIQQMQLVDGTVGEFVTMGIMLATVDKSAKVGDYIAYDNTTGALTVVANPGAGTTPPAPSGKTLVPNCQVDRFPQTNSTGGLVVIRLTN